MTQKKTIRVRAVGDKLLSRIDADGMLVQGRYVGRGRNREATAEGEEVPATSYYHRAIERGDIELYKPKPAAPAVPVEPAAIEPAPIAEAVEPAPSAEPEAVEPQPEPVKENDQ